MQVVLRNATTDDASTVAALLHASRRTYIPYAPMAHSLLEVTQWLGDTLIPAGRVTLACTQDAVVGVLATSVAEADGIGWIDQLYLLPGFASKGIGALLLGHGLASLPRPVRLYTFQANAGARRFYERHGFQAIAFTDGSTNEERCPDVLFELAGD